MPVTENVVREESSLTVTSTEGVHEALLIEDVGGAMLLSIAGYQTTKSDENKATTAFDRDTWKYDVTDWIKKRVGQNDGLDGQLLSDETFRVMSLLDTYRSARLEVDQMESERKGLSRPVNKLDEKRRAVSELLTQAVAKHGAEVVKNNPTLQAEILAEAEALQDTVEAEIHERIESLGVELNKLADRVEADTGAQLEEFKESGIPAVQKLIKPFRQLIRLELITPGQSFEGLVGKSVTFGPYGASKKKMAVFLPAMLNAAQMPMTYTEALTFADAAYAEASKSVSIWG
jgi:hypothetical protein